MAIKVLLRLFKVIYCNDTKINDDSADMTGHVSSALYEMKTM